MRSGSCCGSQFDERQRATSGWSARTGNDQIAELLRCNPALDEVCEASLRCPAGTTGQPLEHDTLRFFKTLLRARLDILHKEAVVVFEAVARRRFTQPHAQLEFIHRDFARRFDGGNLAHIHIYWGAVKSVSGARHAARGKKGTKLGNPAVNAAAAAQSKADEFGDRMLRKPLAEIRF